LQISSIASPIVFFIRARRSFGIAVRRGFTHLQKAFDHFEHTRVHKVIGSGVEYRRVVPWGKGLTRRQGDINVHIQTISRKRPAEAANVVALLDVLQQLMTTVAQAIDLYSYFTSKS